MQRCENLTTDGHCISPKNHTVLANYVYDPVVKDYSFGCSSKTETPYEIYSTKYCQCPESQFVNVTKDILDVGCVSSCSETFPQTSEDKFACQYKGGEDCSVAYQ